MVKADKLNLSQEGRNPHAIYFDEPSVTQQSFKDECDINLIIERAANGAGISHLNTSVARYGDFSNVPDYRSALDIVRNANDMFMSLDARVRARFANDPAEFLQFASNPENRDELKRLGLLKPDEAKTPPLASGGAPGEPSGAPSVASSQPKPTPQGVKA